MPQNWKKKTKIAHKSWPIRKKKLFTWPPKKKLHRRIIQTMPKNIISEIEVLVLIYNEIKYLLAVTIIRVEKIVANFWNEAVEEENEVGGGGQKRFRERGWRSRYFNWHMYEWSGSVRRESEDEFLVPNRKKKNFELFTNCK